MKDRPDYTRVKIVYAPSFSSKTSIFEHNHILGPEAQTTTSQPLYINDLRAQ